MWKVIARIHLTVVLLQHVALACCFELQTNKYFASKSACVMTPAVEPGVLEDLVC